MTNFAGETVHANNQSTNTQEQGTVVEVFEDGSVRVQFSDGTTQVMQRDQLQTG